MKNNEQSQMMSSAVKTIKQAAVLCCLFVSPFVASKERVVEVFESCTACHGSKGLGNSALYAPAIAGQANHYIENQIQSFRRGYRGTHPEDVHGQTMKAMADGIQEQDIKPLADYISQLDPPKRVISEEGDEQQARVKRGAALYQSTCMSCHGVHAEGNRLLKTPNLKVIDSEQIIRQVENFAHKRRGQDVEGNISAIWMRSVSTQVTEQQLMDVAAYLQDLR